MFSLIGKGRSWKSDNSKPAKNWSNILGILNMFHLFRKKSLLNSVHCEETIGRFILGNALPVQMNLGKHSFFVWLFVFSLKTGTRRIIRLDEIGYLLLCDLNYARPWEDGSSTGIMRLVPVFTLEKNNQTNNECLPKFVQTDIAPSGIKIYKEGHF